MLEISYKFKIQCQQTDLKLRSLTEKIKIENTIEYLELKQELNDNQEASYEDNPEELLEEILEESPTETFPCDECKKTFKTLRQVKGHKRKCHTKKSSVKKMWTCPTCHEIFSYNEYLKHIKIHGKNRYQCEFCEKWFEHKHVLLTHREIHLDLERPVCTICQNTFKNVNNLRKHITLVHENILVAFCDLCGKGFKQRGDLPKHKRLTHSNERNFECEICNKKFKTNSFLNKHKKMHLSVDERPGKRVCEICSKVSFSTGSHKNHLQTHTDETPFECPICEKKFRSNTTLQRHETVHTGERKFKCEICESTFIRKEHLQVHCRVHNK